MEFFQLQSLSRPREGNLERKLLLSSSRGLSGLNPLQLALRCQLKLQATSDDVSPQLCENLRTDSICPLCFLHPCVASLPSEWLGRGQAAHTANSSIRRVMYGKYWKIISNLSGWTNQLYLAKKLTETHGVHHMREIMPDCVVQKVRTLYPNPAGIPYLGHKWE